MSPKRFEWLSRFLSTCAGIAQPPSPAWQLCAFIKLFRTLISRTNLCSGITHLCSLCSTITHPCSIVNLCSGITLLCFLACFLLQAYVLVFQTVPMSLSLAWLPWLSKRPSDSLTRQPEASSEALQEVGVHALRDDLLAHPGTERTGTELKWELMGCG